RIPVPSSRGCLPPDQGSRSRVAARTAAIARARTAAIVRSDHRAQPLAPRGAARLGIAMVAAFADGYGAPIRAMRLADWRERPGLEAEWERLLELAGGSIFQSLAWQLAWWEAFGAGRELVAVVAE